MTFDVETDSELRFGGFVKGFSLRRTDCPKQDNNEQPLLKARQDQIIPSLGGRRTGNKRRCSGADSLGIQPDEYQTRERNRRASSSRPDCLTETTPSISSSSFNKNNVKNPIDLCDSDEDTLSEPITTKNTRKRGSPASECTEEIGCSFHRTDDIARDKKPKSNGETAKQGSLESPKTHELKQTHLHSNRYRNGVICLRNENDDFQGPKTSRHDGDKNFSGHQIDRESKKRSTYASRDRGHNIVVTVPPLKSRYIDNSKRKEATKNVDGIGCDIHRGSDSDECKPPATQRVGESKQRKEGGGQEFEKLLGGTESGSLNFAVLNPPTRNESLCSPATTARAIVGTKLGRLRLSKASSRTARSKFILICA
jgi:hypothetical protein